MSTKIYQAWRMTPAEYPAFVRELADFGAKKAAAHIKAMLCPRKKDIRRAVAVIVASSLRHEWEIGACELRAKVVTHGRLVYVVPFSDMALYDFSPSVGVDYCYWNNTDMPEGMSRREWRQRRDVWDTILDTAWATAPTVELIDAMNQEHVVGLFLESHPKADEWAVREYHREAVKNLRAASERLCKKIDKGGAG